MDSTTTNIVMVQIMTSLGAWKSIGLRPMVNVVVPLPCTQLLGQDPMAAPHGDVERAIILVVPNST
jgi:hypothetical protein